MYWPRHNSASQYTLRRTCVKCDSTGLVVERCGDDLCCFVSDVSSSNGEKRDDEDKAEAKGGIDPSLGQMIVLFELMNKLRVVRRLKDSTAMSSDRRGSVNAIAVILVSLRIGMILFGVLVIGDRAHAF